MRILKSVIFREPIRVPGISTDPSAIGADDRRVVSIRNDRKNRLVELELKVDGKHFFLEVYYEFIKNAVYEEVADIPAAAA
jgi:hypothetical protein